MNNELNQHKKSDTIKWVITFVALILLAASVLALGAKVFGGAENAVTEDNANVETDANIPVYADGISTAEVVNSDLVLLSAMAYSAPADSGWNTNMVKVNATVLPAGAPQGLNWTVSFVDPTDEWAVGKNAADYVTVNQDNADGSVVFIQALNPFASQIKVTATSRVASDVSAYLTVDYTQKLAAIQDFDIGASTYFVNVPNSDVINYVQGIKYGTADEMVALYCDAIEIDPTLTAGTIESPIVETVYMVKVSEAFLVQLQKAGIASKCADFTYLGDGEFNAALVINTLVGANIIPYNSTGTVNTNQIQKFNEAAKALDGNVAFTISVQLVTELEFITYNFDFAFDSESFAVYPSSIEFDVSNVVL